jgi:predicted HTH transcriptional regulator
VLDKPLQEVTGADIQALVDAGVAESRRLEFKEQLPGRDDKGLVEFCKDVTALANAQGGDLLFGVREERDEANKPTGRAQSVVGHAQPSLPTCLRHLVQGSLL